MIVLRAQLLKQIYGIQTYIKTNQVVFYCNLHFRK